MKSKRHKRKTMSKKSIGWLRAGALASLIVGLASPSEVAAQSGNFVAVLSDTTGAFGDSQASVLFFDANNMAGGPMFSVFKGYEGGSNADFVDGLGIDVDPATGNVYFVEFDSSSANPADTPADIDLFRIDFSTVYSHWETNFKGKNARDPQASVHVDLDSPVPSNGVAVNPPGSIKNSTNQSYVTYSIGPHDGGAFGFGTLHSNQFTLPGIISKIGEVKRNNSTNPSPFFVNPLTFIDDETLLMMDDSALADTAESAATDHQYRLLERVSTTPGLANGASVDFLDGGYNQGAAESWNSRRIGQVNLDFDEAGVPAGHSEPESMTAFYTNPGGAVRGVWVSESDGRGDTIAFLQLDAANAIVGYRPLSTTGNPTRFSLDDDPAVSTTTNDGKSDNIFIDQDTGDVIIVESGFADTTDLIGLGDIEPSVVRLNINSYDNGSGQIDVGAWDAKVTLAPTKTPGATGLVRGYWSAYDSATDKVYFMNPGGGSDTPQFGNDIWVLDLATGTTMSVLDVDDSISLFTNDSFGDKLVAFTLGATPAEDADFDNDDDVDGNDFLIWQRGLGVGNNNATGDADGNGIVNAADLGIWKSQFGVAATAVAGAVPEPTSLAMGAFGCLAAVASSRRRRA